jgi:predicted ABC-type ATPase
VSDPVLHVLAGPNGAGKTTLYERAIGPVTHLQFINADVIAAERWPGAEAAHAYDASGLAAAQRDRFIAERRSFVAETVFSHPSKVELLTAARGTGYLITLHVVLIPEELAVLRVTARVRRGGHAVPEQKIRERWGRLWEHVAAAAPLADDVIVYDNSTAKRPFRIVAQLRDGRSLRTPTWPAWAPESLRAMIDP